MDILDSLTSDQRSVLNDFTAITNSSDLDSACAVLQSTDWDLQSAIAKIYDGNPTPGPSSRPTPPAMDQFRIDDSAVVPPAGGARPQPEGILGLLRRICSLPLAVLSVPAGLLYSATGVVLTLIARLLRIRPGVNAIRPRNPFTRDRTRPKLSPASAAERWIQSLREMTGTPDLSIASSSSVGTSSSGLRRRAGSERALPDFLAMGYEDAVKKAKSEKKVLMVVLSCEEHENDLIFKRTVLTNSELSAILDRDSVLCWGGDIKDRDAYQAYKTLQPFSFPFIAFLSLQPSHSTSSSSSPRMSLISRMEGSPVTSTSAQIIITHLTTVVLPRVSPFLDRLKAVDVSRNAERKIREEQDRAYAATARQDEERVLRKRAEEAERKAALERQRLEEEERIRAAQELETRKVKAERWRAWRLRTLGVEKGAAKIVVRLGDGRRVVRAFEADQTVEDVYAWIECTLDPPTSSATTSPPSEYTHNYEFTLVSTFPRAVVPVDSSKTVESVGWTQGANLIVEGLSKRRISMGSRDEEDDDADEEIEDEED